MIRVEPEKMRYLKWNVVFFHCGAMYPLPKDASPIVALLFYLSRLLCPCVLASAIILALTDVFMRDEYVFTDISNNILQSGVILASLIRLVYYYKYDYKLKSIIERMNLEFRDQTETLLSEETMKEHTRFSRRYTLAWTGFVVFTVEFMAVMPLVFLPRIGKTLALPAWYPFDWKEHYAPVMFWQNLSQFVNGIAYANADVFYVAAIHLIAGQFKLVRWEFRNVMYTALRRFGIPEAKVLAFSDTFNGGENSMGQEEYDRMVDLMGTTEYQSVLHDCLVKCVRHHQVLLDFCDEFNDFMSPILLPILGCGLFYIIFIAFCMIVTTDESAMLSLGEYFVTAMFELFLYSYFGQRLTDEGTMLADSMYECPWYIGRNKFGSNFKFAQFRTTTVVAVRAGGYFRMNMNLFFVICKTAASYFAVLRQVTEVEQ